MTNITRKDIYDRISADLKIEPEFVSKIVESFFDEFKKCIKNGDKIEFRNFGVFQMEQRKAKVGRNLKTNEPINLPPQKYVSFKAGKEIKDRINE